jgi:hypothetical protein
MKNVHTKNMSLRKALNVNYDPPAQSVCAICCWPQVTLRPYVGVGVRASNMLPSTRICIRLLCCAQFGPQETRLAFAFAGGSRCQLNKPGPIYLCLNLQRARAMQIDAGKGKYALTQSQVDDARGKSWTSAWERLVCEWLRTFSWWIGLCERERAAHQG